MVGPYHQAPARPGDGVLGDHALTRLDVSQGEVFMELVIEGHLGFSDRVKHGVAGGLYVDGMGLIGLDECKRALGIFLIALDSIGQTHGDESQASVAALFSRSLHGQLGQTTSGGGIHAAADAQYIAFLLAVQQIILEKLDATLRFLGRIEMLRDLQGLDDVALKGFGHRAFSLDSRSRR